jgi:gliding motility-associated-like protein
MSSLSYKLLLALCLLPPIGLLAQTVCGGTLSGDLLGFQSFGAGQEPVQPGDPFLSPALSYQSTGPWVPGTYSLMNTTALPGRPPCWIIIQDNSNEEEGYFLAAYAGADPVAVIEQGVEWCGEGRYILSADLINLSSDACMENGVTISFFIDNTEVYNSGQLPANGNWEAHQATFDIPAGTQWSTIRIVADGAGFGIDNLQLQYCQPILELPDTVRFCNGQTTILTLNGADTLFSNPAWQWQQSFDGGSTWVDVNGATAPTLTIDPPLEGVQYRILGANSPVAQSGAGCASLSNTVSLLEQQPVEVYQTPVICQGDTAYIGQTPLYEPGNHSVTLPGGSGCDSLVHAFLFVHPVYEQWFTQHLCYGETFLGKAWTNDTLLTLQYETTAGCDSLVTYDIEVAAPDTFAITGALQICAGAATTLSAPGGYNDYAWSNGATTATATITTGGTYTVSFSDSQGCPYEASATVISGQPLFDVSAIPPDCPDDQDGQLRIPWVESGTPPYAYRLNGGDWQSGNHFEGLTPGDYVAEVQDAAGCSAEVPIYLEAPEEISLSWSGWPDGLLNAGDTLFLNASAANANTQFEWSGPGRFSCASCPSTQFTALMSGLFRVRATTPEGCTATLDTTLAVASRYRLYLPTAFSPNGDGNNDYFEPGFGSNVVRVLRWDIYDRWGGQLFEGGPALPGAPQLRWDGSRNGAPLPPGLYLYHGQIEFEHGQVRETSGEVLLLR